MFASITSRFSSRIAACAVAFALGFAQLLFSAPAPAVAVPGSVPGVPTGLTVTDTSVRSLDVSWPAVESSTDAPVTGYRVEYRTPNGVWLLGAETDTDTRTATISGLVASTRYELRVAATNAAGTGEFFVYGAPIAMDMSASVLCVVRSNGVVYCDGHERQVGAEALSVTVGKDHYCALTVAGVRCWGGNQYGQLGLGHTSSVSGYTNPTGLSSELLDLQAYADSTCALTADNQLWCWGKNNWGRTGLAASARVNPTPGLVASNVVDFTVGTDVCFVTRDGVTQCEDGFYAGSRRTTFTSFSLTSRIFGPHYFCIDSTVGAVECATSTSNVPGVTRVWPSAIRDMEVGNLHTCAVTMSGEAWCRGNNSEAQLGQGYASSLGSSTPIQVTGLGTVTMVAIEPMTGSNRYRTCAANAASTVYCWGGANPAVTPLSSFPVVTAVTADQPQPVIGMQQTGNSATSASVSWSAARPTTYGAVSYTVEWSRDGQSWTSVEAGAATSWTFTGLPSASAVLYRIVTHSGAETSAASTPAVAYTRGTRTANLTVVNAAGLPVFGGSLTWSNPARTLRSAQPLGLTSSGQVAFPLIPAGPVTFTLSGVQLQSGATADAVVTETIGLDAETQIHLPAEPSEVQHLIQVRLPNGEPVVGASVQVDGLITDVTTGATHFTAPDMPSAGLTDDTGTFRTAGYVGPGGATATVNYNDGVLDQTAVVDVSEYITTVTLEEMPYVVAPNELITTTAGTLVTVTMPVGDAQSLSPRAKITVVPPSGASQRCRGVKLSGVPDANGHVTVKMCATKSGTYSLRGAGIATTGSVTVNLKGAQSSGVTALRAESPASGKARIEWQAPVLRGGLRVTEYVVLVQGAGKTVSVRTTKLTATLSALNHATTYTVTVIPVTKAGYGARTKVLVPVA